MTPRKRGRPGKDEYLSPREAAEIMTASGYPVSGRTVARMLDAGTLAGLRVGTHRRILRTTVDDYLSEHLDSGSGSR